MKNETKKITETYEVIKILLVMILSIFYYHLNEKKLQIIQRNIRNILRYNRKEFLPQMRQSIKTIERGEREERERWEKERGSIGKHLVNEREGKN